MRRHKLRIHTLLLAVACLFLTLPAHSAPGAPEEDPGLPREGASGESVETTGADDFIPASGIAVTAESWQIELRSMLDELRQRPVVREAVRELPNTIRDIERLSSDPKLDLLDQLSWRRLEELENRWGGVRSQLASWQRRLDEVSDQLEALMIRLEDELGRWERTRARASADSLPRPVIARVDLMIEKTSEVRVEVVGDLDEVLKIQDDIAEHAFVVARTIAEIDALEQRARGRILVRDSPQFWKDLGREMSEPRLLEQARQSWSEDLAILRTIWSDLDDELVQQLVAFVVLVALMIGLRFVSRRLSTDDEALRGAMFVVSRPVASSLLIVLLCSAFFYPRAPVLVFDVVEILALLAVLRLLPGLVEPDRRAPVGAIIVLLILNELRTVALEQTVAARILLLLASTAGVVLYVWSIRRRPSHAMSRWGAATQVALRLGTGILGAAIVLNILGWVALADLLTNATLQSTRAGILVAFALGVLVGLITLAVRTRSAQLIPSLRTQSALIVRRLRGILHASAVILWLVFTLRAFRILEPVLQAVQGLLSHKWNFGAISISLGGVLAFVVTVWGAVLLSRFVRFVLEEDILSRLRLPRGVPATISVLVHYVIVGLGIVLALGAAGIEFGQFAIVAGALGVGIGFGLQNLVNNFVSGLILIFERPIQAGDVVEVGNLVGRVRRIGIRSSVVRTFTGAEVIVPNGNLVSSEVINWTLSDRLRRVEIEVGVRYGSDPKAVMGILMEVAREHEDVMDFPEPVPLFNGFGDSSLDFGIRFWTTDFDNWVRVASEIRVRVYDAFAAADIEIPFPQRDLHLRSVDPTVQATLSGEGSPIEAPTPRSAPDGRDATPASGSPHRGESPSIPQGDPEPAGDDGDGDS